MLPIFPLPDRRAISRSALSFPLLESSLPLPELPHPLEVKCEAGVGDIYKKSARVRVRLMTCKPIKLSENTRICNRVDMVVAS